MPPAKPCEFCDAAKGAKDYHELGIRACFSCIQDLTISDYRLTNDYDLPRSLLQGVRHSTSSLWSRRGGQYELDFYLVDEVLPILAEHHKCQPTFDSISAKVLESREDAQRRKKDLARERARRVASHKRAVSKAVKDAGFLIGDAQRCPSFRQAVRNEYSDALQVVSEVSNFLADLGAKSLWMSDLSSQISEISSPEVRAKVLWMTKTFSNDDSYTFQRAKEETLRIVETFKRIADYKSVLERFLRAKTAKIPEPFSESLIVRGLEWIRKEPLNFKESSFASQKQDTNFREVTRRFESFFDQLVKAPKIVESVVRTKHHFSLKNLSDHERFELHDRFQKSYTTYSTGSDYNRVLHIISDDFWDDVFPVHLPIALVRESIADPIFKKPPSIKKPPPPTNKKRPEKSYYCNECGKMLEREEVIVSVYHSGLWCEECVEADDELRGSKWENL